MSGVHPDKAFATVQVRAALAGIALTRLADGRSCAVFIVSRWSVTRQFGSLQDVENWLDRVTGRIEAGAT